MKIIPNSSTILYKALSVDRNKFLRDTFPQVYQNSTDMPLPSPRKAGISKEKLRQKALSIINNHTLVCSSVSFGLGLPSNPYLAPATIAGDLSQYLSQLIIMAQKIGYLHGLQDLSSMDDEAQFRLQKGMLMIMLGQGTNRALSNLIKSYSKPLGKYILKKSASNGVARKVIAFFVTKLGGEVLTKKGISRFLSKLIPGISGCISFAITWGSFKKASNRLLDYFEEEFVAA